MATTGWQTVGNVTSEVYGVDKVDGYIQVEAGWDNLTRNGNNVTFTNLKVRCRWMRTSGGDYGYALWFRPNTFQIGIEVPTGYNLKTGYIGSTGIYPLPSEPTWQYVNHDSAWYVSYSSITIQVGGSDTSVQLRLRTNLQAADPNPWVRGSGCGLQYKTVNVDIPAGYPYVTQTSASSGAIPATDTSGMWVDFMNSAQVTTSSFVEVRVGGNTTYITGTAEVWSRHVFNMNASTAAAIQTAMANVNWATVRIGISATIGGVTEYSYKDSSISIDNTGGVANPTFTTVNYADTNATTVAITGNNQYIIQGKSTLRATVTAANRAIANKHASMVKYAFYMAGFYSESAWSSSSDVHKNMEVNLGSSPSQSMLVTSVDSRGNTKQVEKYVSVVPYASPQVYASGTRLNGFEDDTTISINGVVSPLNVGGTVKNDVNPTNGVRYRYREAGGAWGSWTNRASSFNTSTGAVTTTPFVMTLDKTKQFEFEFRITDKLETKTQTVIVSRGQAIFRIGIDGRVYNNEEVIMRTHIGQIIQSVTLTTASAVAEVYGGTWVRFGNARSIVGVSPDDPALDAAEKTGGSFTHTHPLSSAGHAKLGFGWNSSRQNYIIRGKVSGVSAPGGNEVMTNTQGYSSVSTENIWEPTALGGATDEGSSVSPFITVHLWKRTA